MTISKCVINVCKCCFHIHYYKVSLFSKPYNTVYMSIYTSFLVRRCCDQRNTTGSNRRQTFPFNRNCQYLRAVLQSSRCLLILDSSIAFGAAEYDILATRIKKLIDNISEDTKWRFTSLIANPLENTRPINTAVSVENTCCEVENVCCDCTAALHFMITCPW